MIPWEGAADFYRDFARHGGIFSNAFLDAWYPRQIVSVQHGNSTALLDPWQKQSASGADNGARRLSPEQLAVNRRDPQRSILEHKLDDDFYKQRSPEWSKVIVPFLSAASWAGFGLHPRGNFEAFTQAASEHKWLECHPGRHEEWFYLDRGMVLQKDFMDHFLKGIENRWDQHAPVLLNVRRPFSRETEFREEQAWPLPSTQWTQMYLAGDCGLSWSVPQEASATFEALGDPAQFMSAPLKSGTELTGPLAAKIFASSSTSDMDLFVTLQAFAPDGREVDFQGTVDPHTPLAQGWLRASHRKLDLARSLPYRPYHSHDEVLSVEPGEIYELSVEIWPTNVTLSAGYRLGLQISGHDFERPTPADANEAWVSRGSGPWLHTHPEDRPRSIFGGRTTIHMGGPTASYVLLPVIP